MAFPNLTPPPIAPDFNDPATRQARADAWIVWWGTNNAEMVSWTFLANALTGVTSSFQFIDGSALTPAMSFASDPDTGIFRVSANNLGFSTGGVPAVQITGTQNALFGNTVNLPGAAARVQLSGVGTGANSNDLAMAQFSANSSGPDLWLGKSRDAALNAYTIIQAGDTCGSLVFKGSDGSTFFNAATIRAVVEGTPSLGNVVAGLRFLAGPGEIMRVSNDGNIYATGGSFGVLAGAAYGGAVTQITSRTTAVTLNKASGEITLFTAAGSATPASFTVNDSKMVATDLVVLNIKSATNKYAAMVTAKGAGTFEITFWALSGVASDAPVISFEIFKGANN